MTIYLRVVPVFNRHGLERAGEKTGTTKDRSLFA